MYTHVDEIGTEYDACRSVVDTRSQMRDAKELRFVQMRHPRERKLLRETPGHAQSPIVTTNAGHL